MSRKSTPATSTKTGRRGAVAAAVAGASLAATLGAQFAAPAAQAHAAGSVTNIPANVYETIANIPAVQYEALQQTTKAFNDSGNWWLYIPTNVVGFDQQDYEKVKAISLLLMPIPTVAAAESDQLWMTLATFAPMTPNCTGVPGPCSDPLYFLQYGRVPMWQLLSPEGYTFPEIRNTIDPKNDTYTNADGDEVAIQPWWSGKTVHLDFLGPAKAVWATLTDDPTGEVKQSPSAEQWAKAYGEFGTAVFNGLNPFVDGTYCLPCQLFGVAGAPGSLPKFALFDKYYTAFNLGQKFTEQDWSLNPAAGYDPSDVGRADYVPVTNIWTRVAWDQIFTDGVTSTRASLAMIPRLPTIVPQNLAAFSEQLDQIATLLAHNVVANVEGVGTAGAATYGSAEELAEMIKQSFVNALPSVTGTAHDSSPSATILHTAPDVAAKKSVTLSAAQALRGTPTDSSTDTAAADRVTDTAAADTGSPSPHVPSESDTGAGQLDANPPATPSIRTPSTNDEATASAESPSPSYSTPVTDSTPQDGGKHRADDNSGYTGRHRAPDASSSPHDLTTDGSGPASAPAAGSAVTGNSSSGAVA